MSNQTFVRMDTYHRREQILDVAADLFAEHGFDGVTTLELSEAIGCSETSLFKLFPTKEEIYKALFREWATAVQEEPTIPIEDNSAVKTLRKFFNLYRTRQISIHRNMRPRLESAIYNRKTGDYLPKIHAILAKQPDIVSTCLAPIIAFGQKNGEIRDGDPFVLATLFWSILWGEHFLYCDEKYHLPFQAIQHIFITTSK